MEKGWPEGSEDFDLRIQSGSDPETVQLGENNAILCYNCTARW